jgi:hypothetical protein
MYPAPWLWQDWPAAAFVLTDSIGVYNATNQIDIIAFVIPDISLGPYGLKGRKLQSDS